MDIGLKARHELRGARRIAGEDRESALDAARQVVGARRRAGVVTPPGTIGMSSGVAEIVGFASRTSKSGLGCSSRMINFLPRT